MKRALKLISLFLVLIMTLLCVPVSTLSAESPPDIQAEETQSTPQSELPLNADQYDIETQEHTHSEVIGDVNYTSIIYCINR